MCESAGGPEFRCVSSVLTNAASEGEGGRFSEGGGCPLKYSRPGSDTYLTASDDSSSLFDDDMERTKRPHFHLPGSREGGLAEKDGVRERKLEDCSSDELNKRFQSQRLDSSSSSSDPSNTPSPILTPTLTPKRPTSTQDSRDLPASPKQPRLRTTAGFGVMSVALAKRHLSQPPISTEAAHGRTRNAISMLRPLRPQETDLDQEQEVSMETSRDTPPQPATKPTLSTSPASFATDEEEPPENPDPPPTVPGSKPPTPPLHRFPSWVSTKFYLPFIVHTLSVLCFACVDCYFRKAGYMQWLSLASGCQRPHVQTRQAKVSERRRNYWVSTVLPLALCFVEGSVIG